MIDPAVFVDALILTGPTASGKTAVGLCLAERLQAEIISMDSMALYRGMDIGTAKPSTEERARVPHHLVDVLDPWESSSLAWWLGAAADRSRAILGRGRRVLLVGGTPLYLKAVLRGIFEGPAAKPEVRWRLEQQPGPELHARLVEVDPPAACKIHPHDVRRLVRALEVLELTGRPISAWQEQFARIRPRRWAPIWLDLDRAALYGRIDQRVQHMLERGWLTEVGRLAALPQPLSKEARQALGYQELLDHLAGRSSMEETRRAIQTHSRQFAKRQFSWFRHLAECRRLAIKEEETAEEIASRIAALWSE